MVAFRIFMLIGLLCPVITLAQQDRKQATPSKQQEAKEAAEQAQRDKFIASMPKDAAIPELNTEDFDKAASDFKWTAEATDRIAKLKQRIVDKRTLLLQQQSDARRKCEAGKLVDLDYLARRYLEVRGQCDSYKPIKDFYNGLANILVAADMAKLKEKGVPPNTPTTR